MLIPTLKEWALIAGVLGGFIGMYAALIAFKAARVDTSPEWLRAGNPEPGDAELARYFEIAGLQRGAFEAARLNARAAGFAGIAGLFGGVSAVLSYFG